jgi:hypothetical protein
VSANNQLGFVSAVRFDCEDELEWSVLIIIRWLIIGRFIPKTVHLMQGQNFLRNGFCPFLIACLAINFQSMSHQMRNLVAIERFAGLAVVADWILLLGATSSLKEQFIISTRVTIYWMSVARVTIQMVQMSSSLLDAATDEACPT